MIVWLGFCLTSNRSFWKPCTLEILVFLGFLFSLQQPEPIIYKDCVYKPLSYPARSHEGLSRGVSQEFISHVPRINRGTSCSQG